MPVSTHCWCIPYSLLHAPSQNQKQKIDIQISLAGNNIYSMDIPIDQPAEAPADAPAAC
jgi:hypothetical protein